jgi:hypothetical protein
LIVPWRDQKHVIDLPSTARGYRAGFTFVLRPDEVALAHRAALNGLANGASRVASKLPARLGNE